MEGNEKTLSKSSLLGEDILMILVTLGTQKQQFCRLLDYIEKSEIKDRILVQAGHTKYVSKKMEVFDFINYEKMEQLIDEADVVITHGGTGSIITPLKKGKRVIVCARKKEYGEHVDNHQTEIVEVLREEGYILELNECNKIDELMKEITYFKPKEYQENTDKFIEELKKEIGKYLL